ncbi:GTP cyclohydrolase I FolE [Pedobacter sp. Du54]|uniref:GTP cyclohydrolase I FolE n=1 Tax=Pedobacter anseongensis TaxID=3133439 RepID=UPI0030952298
MLADEITTIQNKSFTYESPLKAGAFEMDDETKISLIESHFSSILDILGLDLKDGSIKDTPKRIAKMYVSEIFSGLNPANKPKPTLFENPYQYDEMLIEKNISVFSNCEHHFVPIVGKAHVAYISNGKVIGLSKLNRIVRYYAQRPQVQERLTMQIAEEIKSVMGTEDVAVVIDASHHCVSSRGIRDAGSTTITSAFSGRFKEIDTKNQFLKQIGS